MREYNADLVRVVNGHTIDLEVELGFNVAYKQRFILSGIGCEEKHTKKGLLAYKFLKKYEGKKVKIKVDSKIKEPKWVELYITIDDNEINVSDFLIVSGFGKPVINKIKNESRGQQNDYTN